MIVAILGPAGSGKDTMADRLVARYGFIKIALADPLKRICREVYDFSPLQLWGPSEERNKPDMRYPLPDGQGYLTPRMALQTLGSTWGRSLYTNTWVDYCLRMADKVQEGWVYSQEHGLRKTSFLSRVFKDTKSVVIPDMRLRNEVTQCQKKGAVTIRLKRVGKGGDVQGGVKGHDSEIEQMTIPDAMFDHIIEVPEGIPFFHKLIDASMDNILDELIEREIQKVA